MAFSFEKLNDPAYFAEHRLPHHSDHRWFPSREDGLDGINPLCLSLNGNWYFACARNEAQVPAGFEAAGFDCRSWASIPVPAHIQMEGYGVPQYVNQQYPWEGWEQLEPGEVPRDFNPVACYVKYFTLPDAMEGKRLILCLQGAESCAAVWLNGEYIGYSANSFSPCEFELTEALRPGENKLAIRVYRWNCGSWLEDQDFFRFSGLYRDVSLYALPERHIQDLKIVPRLNETLDEGTVELSGKISGGGNWQLGITADGAFWGTIRGSSETFSTVIRVKNPRLWSAEQPELYEAELSLYDAGGRLLEVVPQVIGFRRFELKDGLMLLNGKRIVFKGVNRHDFSAEVGRAVTEEHIRRDLITMKRNNINALRTSHYPNNALVYELCDRLGLYVIAENNMESHGTHLNAPRPDYGLPEDRPEWTPMLLDRVDATYETAKNHPSVLIWSLGNESGGGSVIRDMARHFHALDDTRLVHYEGVFHDRRYSDESSDMESQMYPSAVDILRFLAEHPGRPFLCCEYSHSMGNSNGGLSYYTDLAEEEPRYQGGFIWDYIDQAIRGKDRYGRTAYYYGGDLGDRPCDYAFSGNGICYADGTETPKMAEVKYDYQNISVVFGEKTFTVRNKHLFTSTSAYDCAVRVEKNGKLLRETALETDVPPLSEASFPLPLKPDERPGEYAVTVSFRLKRSTLWAERGHEIAFGQGVYQIGAPAVQIPSGSPLKIVETGFDIGVTGSGFRVLFSKLDGGLASYQYGGKELLKAIPLPNFWRPMVENDLGGQVNLICAQWKTASEFVSCRQPGLGYWNEAYHPTVERGDGDITVTYTYHMPTVPASECRVSYRVLPSGEVECTLRCEPAAELPPMPEFGMLFRLDADYDRLTWYGNGPGESYIDRCNGVRLGIWEGSVQEQMARYLRPQESGSHTGVRWAKVTDDRGRGLLFSGDKMEFSALPWTPHEIDCAQHPFELPPIHNTIVRCSWRQMGVGGDDTWGSRPHPEFWLPTGEPLCFTFRFRGCGRE